MYDKKIFDYFESNPGATTVAFYRAYHARLRRKILEISEPSEPLPNIKISPADKKIAADIHKYVMKKKKKGHGVETAILGNCCIIGRYTLFGIVIAQSRYHNGSNSFSADDESSPEKGRKRNWPYKLM